MAQVTVKGIVKRYGSAQVIHGVDVDIADGEFVVLVGSSARRAAASPRCCG